jgi:flagellar protein FlaJ
MPVSKAIIYVSNNDYGPLNKFVKKLANQVEWAIPVHKAFMTFANATDSDVIKRSISTVIEAEEAGGNMEDVLESITISLVEIKKIKETRRASVNSQVIQSYVIFFVFLGVMILIQNLLIPYIANMQNPGSDGFQLSNAGVGGMVQKVSLNFSSLQDFISSLIRWFLSLNGVFLMLALIQGFFAGVVIGKLSEGELSAGFKHSLILMTVAFFIITLSQG